jgi:hypothetical protein
MVSSQPPQVNLDQLAEAAAKWETAMNVAEANQIQACERAWLEACHPGVVGALVEAAKAAQEVVANVEEKGWRFGWTNGAGYRLATALAPFKAEETT